jgi:hypothetical protein
MSPAELKEILQSAAEAANVVPADLQPVAFAKAVELLLSSAPNSNRHSLRRAQAIAGDTNAVRGRLSSNRPGPKSALDILFWESYFETKRTQSEIQRSLRESKGYEYSLNELSISLLRVVRKGILKREKNDDGHYLYYAAKIETEQVKR